MDGVLIGRRYAHGWTHRMLGLACRSFGHGDRRRARRRSFEIDDPAYAWLAFSDGYKGLAWLNGFLLGRYWPGSPQVTL